MHSEIRKKRKSSTSAPTAEDDHRKRRRNRTTQSCVSCHTSKRLCDRKRPACARCTQLGLMGLCVYEIDDPNQRTDSQDEVAHLLKRVAELEGVIRELKNKPHPRWSQTMQLRPHSDGGSEGQDVLSEISSPQSSFESRESTVIERKSTNSSTQNINMYPSITTLPPTCRPSSSHSPYQSSTSSPPSTPSPSLMTPIEERASPFPFASIAGPPDMSSDYDLSPLFPVSPGLSGSDESCFMKQPWSHCGCLHESDSYSAVLELSLRLRRAADILARSPSHHIGSPCLLHQRISHLDTFTLNTLGDVLVSHEGILLGNQDRVMPTNAAPLTHQLGSSPHRASSKSSNSRTLQHWDMLSTDSSQLPPCDDSFMSWQPHGVHR